MCDVVLTTLRDEFTDLGDAAQFTRVALRLVLAVALAGAIGFERELRGRTAGLRTHMMLALGVALAVVIAEQAGIDLSRVMQGVLAGIGFLGAGAIIKRREEEEVTGLTTAASIWATAAIALAAGLGREATAVLATGIALVILAVLRHADERIAEIGAGRDKDD
ncbi:MAG: MgtC/SapB family protein [Casimicrobiaceae bacterium]